MNASAENIKLYRLLVPGSVLVSFVIVKPLSAYAGYMSIDNEFQFRVGIEEMCCKWSRHGPDCEWMTANRTLRSWDRDAGVSRVGSIASLLSMIPAA